MNGGDNSAVLIGQAVFYRLHRRRGEEVVMSLSGKSMLMAAILMLTIELDYQLKITEIFLKFLMDVTSSPKTRAVLN